MSEKQLFLSEVYQNLYTSSKDAVAIVFDFNEPISGLQWSRDSLVCGTFSGKLFVFNQIQMASVYTLPTEFQKRFILERCEIDVGPVFGDNCLDLVRFNAKYILVGSTTVNKLLLIQHGAYTQFSGKLSLAQFEHRVFELPVANDEYVTSVDLTLDGTVSATGSFAQVFVFENSGALAGAGGESYEFRLNCAGSSVQFASLQNKPYLVVCEASNCVKLLDWRQGVWSLTLFPYAYDAVNFPKELIKVFVNTNNDEILVVGYDGVFKKYSLKRLSGSTGYSEPSQSGKIIGLSPTNSFVHSSDDETFWFSALSKQHIFSYDFGGIFKNSSSVETDADSIIKARELNISLPSSEVTAGSVSYQGIVAFASGNKLILVNN